jgi:arylsulfatase A-like enzyme
MTGRKITRKDFLRTGSAGLGALLLQTALPGSRARGAGDRTHSERDRPNILFITMDQLRSLPDIPERLPLPVLRRLQRESRTFSNYYVHQAPCGPSRATFYTGQHIQKTGMYTNPTVEFGEYSPGAARNVELRAGFPTLGTMLREQGYYTAYKGKWHLSRKFDVADRLEHLNTEMDKYGFSDFLSPGDIMAHALGGYEFDNLIGGSAVTWLRRKGQAMAADGKPFALFVSLINPHDIMYFNTDLPGQHVQDTGGLLMHAARAPNNSLYKANWDMPIPQSLTQPFDVSGRPKAHGEFENMWSYVLGRIPPEADRWRRFNDFYVNSIRSVDVQVDAILNELDALQLADRTIVIFTSDHGEMAGAHGLRGKGPFAYEENLHLPFYVIHPDVKGGQDCRALSGHIDLVPSLLAMAGVDATKRAEFAGRQLPGKDLTQLLTNPSAAEVHAQREAVLYTYSCLATNDSGVFQIAAEAKAAGKKPALALLKRRYVPDMKKRGSVRTAFDGRYKFSRYFSPLDHNHPTTLDQLYSANDVELFDLDADPQEVTNLAADKNANQDLIMAMNGKLETVIKAEIGLDDGRELPNIPLVTWTIDRVS